MPVASRMYFLRSSDPETLTALSPACSARSAKATVMGASVVLHASHRLGRTVRAGHALEGVKASPETEQDDGAGQETRDGSLPTGESHRDGPRGILRGRSANEIDNPPRATIYHPRNQKLCQPGQRIEER